jgi:tRNA U34 5-methylaminomethyl-2-thiouridine-forming methyltransferase MnmC
MPLTGALRLEPTADGSFTFYSEDFGEWFHSRKGAYAEARQTYVEATQLRQAAQQPQLCLLDVCYGLGYNSAAALEAIWQVNPACQVTLAALELDRRVPHRAIAHHLTAGWSKPVQEVLQRLAANGCYSSAQIEARLLLGDARQQIQPLITSGFQADAVFLDPFSPPHCPELWTVEFLASVAACLAPQGHLATYSCAAAVRTALTLAGLYLGPTQATGRRWPGTLARFTAAGLAPLSLQEQEHLQTRAAVPYRDPLLKDSAATICQRRQQEQATSPLVATARWRQRWLSPPSPDGAAQLGL